MDVGCFVVVATFEVDVGCFGATFEVDVGCFGATLEVDVGCFVVVATFDVLVGCLEVVVATFDVVVGVAATLEVLVGCLEVVVATFDVVLGWLEFGDGFVAPLGGCSGVATFDVPAGFELVAPLGNCVVGFDVVTSLCGCVVVGCGTVAAAALGSFVLGVGAFGSCALGSFVLGAGALGSVVLVVAGSGSTFGSCAVGDASFEDLPPESATASTMTSSTAAPAATANGHHRRCRGHASRSSSPLAHASPGGAEGRGTGSGITISVLLRSGGSTTSTAPTNDGVRTDDELGSSSSAGGRAILAASPAPIGTNAVAEGGAGNDELSQLSSRVAAGTTGIGAESDVVDGGSTMGERVESSRGRAANAITESRAARAGSAGGGATAAGSTAGGSTAAMVSVVRIGSVTTAFDRPLLFERPRPFGGAGTSVPSATLIVPLLRERLRAAVTAEAAATVDALAVGTGAGASTVVWTAMAATISVVAPVASKPDVGGTVMPMPERVTSAAGVAGGANDATPAPEIVTSPTSAGGLTIPTPARVTSPRGVPDGIWIVFGRWRVGAGTGARVTRLVRSAGNTTGAVGSLRGAPSGITTGDADVVVGAIARACARAASIGEALVLNADGATLVCSASLGGGARPVPLPSKSTWTVARGEPGAVHGSGRSPNRSFTYAASAVVVERRPRSTATASRASMNWYADW